MVYLHRIIMNRFIVSLTSFLCISLCAEQQYSYEDAVKTQFSLVSRHLSAPKLSLDQCPTVLQFAHLLSTEYLGTREEYVFDNANCFVPNFEEAIFHQGMIRRGWVNMPQLVKALGIHPREGGKKTLEIAQGRRARSDVIPGQIIDPFILGDLDTGSMVKRSLRPDEYQIRANSYAYYVATINEEMLISVFGLTRAEILQRIKELHDQYDELEHKEDIPEDSYYQQYYSSSGIAPICFYKSPAIGFQMLSVGQTDQSTLNNLAHLATAQTTILSNFFGRPKATDIDLVLYHSQVKKKLPAPGQAFSYGSVNSGTTLDMVTPHSIILLRDEEIGKVLLHELCHHVLGSRGECNSPLLGKKNLNESFVETVAVVSNCTIKSIFGHAFNDHLYATCIEHERKFSTLQSAKILIHAGYSNYDEYLSDLADQRRVVSSPATIEYHLYKSALLFDLEPFMINAKVNLDEPNAMTQLLVQCLNATAFKEAMTAAFRVARSLSSHGYNELASSMRMTIA